MKCEKHKRYKGIKPPVQGKDCPVCHKIYEEVNKASSYYYSITTPNFYCSVVHVLSECMTVMLYGKQPPFFWRKNVVASFKAKKFFTRALVELKQQEKKNPKTIESVRFLFGILVYGEKRKIESQKIRDRDDLIEYLEEKNKSTEVIADKDIIDSFLSTTKRSTNKWQQLKQLENINGTEEEGN